MLLSVGERLGLLQLLPREGEYATLKTLRVARECLAITPDEVKEFGYAEIPTGHGGQVNIQWDVKKERDKDIPLDEYTTSVIVNLLSKMDKEKKLTEQYVTLYEKFVIK